MEPTEHKLPSSVRRTIARGRLLVSRILKEQSNHQKLRKSIDFNRHPIERIYRHDRNHRSEGKGLLPLSCKYQYTKIENCFLKNKISSNRNNWLATTEI